jgi:hypothetical protein
VMDNLNTHKPASLYKAFPPPEARRILKRLEIHYTPKHGSWLDIAEVELNVMTRQCLSRRVEDIETLNRELREWKTWRNRYCGGQVAVYHRGREKEAIVLVPKVRYEG